MLENQRQSIISTNRRNSRGNPKATLAMYQGLGACA